MEMTTRREFITGTCAAVGLIALGGGARAFAADGQLLRPPGGQDEASLRALCVKCDRCRSVCPTHCVTTANVGDGFLDARTPKLDFHRGYCDFCNRCIEACPTGALRAFDPYADKIGIARVDQAKCIAYTRGKCDVCRDSCPFDALHFDESGRPFIDEAVCNGCGVCVMTCNANVNRAFDGGFERAIEVRPVVSGEVTR